ncbi:hypothetical protein C4577_07325 [Candidatus Parcubacteria bacterium]|nr:MAG: hypothetical protein C4577_07325 [Candidatus Parcubacteria bacterium]
MSKHHKKRNKKSQHGRKGYLWKLLFNGEKMGKCCFCEKPLTFDEATVEHLTPLSEGGSDRIGSGNLNVSCLKCNNGRARNAQLLKRADEMAVKLFEMCQGKREITPRWKTLVEFLKKSGNLSIDLCKDAYLLKKGLNET